MAGHRNLVLEDCDTRRGDKPLIVNYCKEKSCKRSQYVNGYCKYHTDFRAYKKAIKTGL